MNLKLVLLACLILVLFSGVGFAVDVVGCNTVVSSSGYYALTQDVNASNVTEVGGALATGCINITGTNIVFDLGGHTIENSSTATVYGIVVFNNVSNVTIINGTIQNMTSSTGGGILFLASSGRLFNSSVHNITIANATSGVYVQSEIVNITMRSITARNVTHGVYIQYGGRNISIFSSNLTNASNGVVAVTNLVSGHSNNLTIQSTELSFSRVGFNNTPEDGSADGPGLYNTTLTEVYFRNNSVYDFYANNTNNTFFNYVLFNHTNISANFTNYAAFKSSGPVVTAAPLQYNLTYFVNITNVSSFVGNSPRIDLSFYYQASDIPAAADATTLSIYSHDTAWTIVASSVSVNDRRVSASSTITSFRNVDNQYGLFLSAASAAAGDDDDDISEREREAARDEIPFEYTCDAGRLVIETLPGAQVHATQLCDPACDMAAGGVACSADVYDQEADEDGIVTFGGNGYYYVNILQSSSDDYRSEDDFDFCFASCSVAVPTLDVDTDWLCESGILRVIVTDEAGNPISGVLVETESSGENDPQPGDPDISQWQETDENGRAEFWFLPPEHDIFVLSKDGYTSKTIAIPGSDCEARELSFDATGICPGNRIRIFVYDQANHPVADADVVYAASTKESDQNGVVEFDLEDDESVAYIQISKGGYQTVFVQGNSGVGVCPDDNDDTDEDPNGNGGEGIGSCETLEVVADRSDAFVGEAVRVIVRCDSQPVTNQDVVIIPPQGPSQTATTDAQGGITLPLEFQGTYQVGIAKGGEIVDRDNVIARLKPTDDENKDDIFAFLGSDAARISLLVLILGIALIAAYLYMRSTQHSDRKRAKK